MLKTFFQGFNLARALILIFIVGSIYGGQRAWVNHRRIENLKGSLGIGRTGQITGAMSPVERLVRDIQANSVKYTEFTRQLEGEGLVKQKTPLSYITAIKNKTEIALGKVKLTTPSAGSSVKPGYTDNKIIVKPESGQTYDRAQIANFLYTVEAESKRVRVTNLDINSAGKTKPEEIANDRWTFDCEVTVREKNADKKKR